MTASRSRSLTHLCRISTPSSQQKMHCKQPPTCRMLLNQGQPGTRSPRCMLPLVLVPRPEIGPLLMNARWRQLFGWAQNLLCTQTSSWRPYLRKCPNLTPPSFSASATVLSSHCFSVLGLGMPRCGTSPTWCFICGRPPNLELWSFATMC